MGLKKIIKQLIPFYLYNFYHRYRIGISRDINSKKNVKDVFTEIYEKELWAGEKGNFHSGSGSSDEIANIYANEIKKIIIQKNIKTLVDLGCGNFNVGKRIINNNINYTGIDIVENVVKFNNKNFANENIKFICADIIKDELPDAQLCILRQILQHLSNEQISIILRKIRKYKFVVITEHYPSNKFKKIIPNKDKSHGPDVRIYDKSAVYLDKPPFNVQNIELVFEMKLKDYLVKDGETLKTFLMKCN